MDGSVNRMNLSWWAYRGEIGHGGGGIGPSRLFRLFRLCGLFGPKRPDRKVV